MAVARIQRTTDYGLDFPDDPYAVAQPAMPPSMAMPQGSNEPDSAQSAQPFFASSMPQTPPVSIGARTPIAPVKPASITQPPVTMKTATGANVTLPGLPQAQPLSAPLGPIEDFDDDGTGGGSGGIPPPRYQGGGVDWRKWQDPNHNSVKYTTLRIVDAVDPRTLGRPGLLSPNAAGIRAQLQAQGFTIVDEDQISRSDVGTVDILHGDRTEWGWNVGRAKPPKPPIGPPITPPGPPNLPPGGPDDGRPKPPIIPPTPPPLPPGVNPIDPGGFLDLIDRLNPQGPRLDPGYAPPGNPGVFDSQYLQQIGIDPLSQLITAGLAGLINEGGTPLSSDVEGTLRGLIARGGRLPNDANNRNLRYESARELMEKGRRTMMNDARGALASRNLLSEPGIPQGAEISSVRRIQEAIAPEFARELRNISVQENEANDARLSQSLALATGMAQNQAQVMLQALGSASERQQALADISLGVLDRNITWNKFLAEHGLNRDKILNDIQMGRMQAMMPILNAFLQWASLIRGGYI